MKKLTLLKVGVEVEWSCRIRPYSGVEDTWNLQHDGSISGKYESHEFTTKIPKIPVIDTENPTEGIDKSCEQFTGLLNCMSAIDCNDSQGLHIHVSGFKKKSVIYSQEFFEYFLEQYKKMAKSEKEKKRLTRHYCEPTYDQSARHRAINYTHAYREWTTFEFRIFPSTKSVREYRKYLTMLIRCISKFENKKIKPDVFEFKDDIPDKTVTMGEVIL